MRKTVSYSEWMLFRNVCQWRWKLDYLENHRRNNQGVHLDFGSAIHAAIERYRTRKEPCSLDEAVDIFRWSFCLLYGENSPRYEERDRQNDPQDFLGYGENILRRFHECRELASAEVVYNEFKIEMPIDRTDGLEILFKGYVDMVIRTVDGRGRPVLYIVDFKSCSWGWSKEKRQDRELQFQLFLYKHFLCRRFSLDPDLVRCAFVLLKKKPKKGDCPVEFMPVSAGPISVQRALDALMSDLTEMRARVQAGNLQKRRSSCVNAFGQTCPYLHTELCPAAPNV